MQKSKMDERLLLIAEEGGRLDAYVSAHTALTRSAAQRLIRQGSVTVNGRAEKVSYLLGIGDEIAVTVPEAEPSHATAEDLPVDILYQDEDIAVIDKPQGMVVHPSAGHASGTLVNGLLYHLDGLSGVGGELRPGIVHRIDRMTSGLLVVAKNDFAHQSLSDQFRDHSAHRRYVAIVEGNLKQDGGTVHAPVGRHPVDRKRMAVVPNGRDATTHWRVLGRMNVFTLLQLALETGRTHQIRVHMASLQHPVAGDTVYGRSKPQLGLIGQALHGYQLVLRHPRTGEEMMFYAPVPDYFAKAMRRAGSELTAETLLNTLKQLPDSKKEGIL